MKSPIAVRNLTAPVAAPVVFVGRITELPGDMHAESEQYAVVASKQCVKLLSIESFVKLFRWTGNEVIEFTPVWKVHSEWGTLRELILTVGALGLHGLTPVRLRRQPGADSTCLRRTLSVVTPPPSKLLLNTMGHPLKERDPNWSVFLPPLHSSWFVPRFR